MNKNAIEPHSYTVQQWNDPKDNQSGLAGRRIKYCMESEYCLTGSIALCSAIGVVTDISDVSELASLYIFGLWPINSSQVFTAKSSTCFNTQSNSSIRDSNFL